MSSKPVRDLRRLGKAACLKFFGMSIQAPWITLRLARHSQWPFSNLSFYPASGERYYKISAQRKEELAI